MSGSLTVKVGPREVEVELYLEVFHEGGARAYALAHPGFFLDGLSEERILREAPTALWKFGHWLRNHGAEAPFRFSLPRVRVAERAPAHGGPGLDRFTAIFGPERRAPSPEQVARYRERLAWAEEDLVGLARALPPELLLGSGPGAPAPAEILGRLEETERTWLNRCSLEVEAAPDLGPLERALATRRRALEALDRLSREAWGEVFVTTVEGPQGPRREEWSLAKLLRCMLTNQREQIAALRRAL